MRYIHAGERLQIGKVMLTCMHPTEYYVNSDANAGSTVLYLTYENFSALFTGDLEGEGEELVTERLAAMKDASGWDAASYPVENSSSRLEKFHEGVVPCAGKSPDSVDFRRTG